MREREALARDGFILINLKMDRGSGRLLDDPEIITRGFVYTREAEDLLDRIKNRTVDIVKSSNGSPKDDVRQAIKAFVYNETKRRPMLFVTLTN